MIRESEVSHGQVENPLDRVSSSGARGGDAGGGRTAAGPVGGGPRRGRLDRRAVSFRAADRSVAGALGQARSAAGGVCGLVRRRVGRGGGQGADQRHGAGLRLLHPRPRSSSDPLAGSAQAAAGPGGGAGAAGPRPAREPRHRGARVLQLAAGAPRRPRGVSVQHRRQVVLRQSRRRQRLLLGVGHPTPGGADRRPLRPYAGQGLSREFQLRARLLRGQRALRHLAGRQGLDHRRVGQRRQPVPESGRLRGPRDARQLRRARSSARSPAGWAGGPRA